MTPLSAVALTTIVIPLLAIIIAPLLAYFGVAKRLSGKIATSEAKDLWAESTAIRSDYRAENDKLQARIERLEVRIDELGADNRTLREQKDALDGRIRVLEGENRKLTELNEKCLIRIDVLEKRLAQAGEPTNGG